MGDIFKFRLADSSRVTSIYVPFDSTWAKLKSLFYGFFNVNYDLKMERIEIIDAGKDLDAVVETWDEKNFNFVALNAMPAHQELVFVIHVEKSANALPSPPPLPRRDDRPTTATSPVKAELSSPLSSTSFDASSGAELELSSSLMVVNVFNKHTFKKLVSHEFPVDKVFEIDQNSEFLKLCARGEASQLETLLNNDAVTDDERVKGMFLASSCGHLSVLELLFKEGVSPDTVEPSCGLTPVNIACLNKHEDIAKWLVDKDCNITKTNRFGATPLHYICYNSMTSLLPSITKANADIVTEGRFSLCHYATGAGSVTFVEHLVMLGADVNSWDSVGNYPLHYAAAAGVLECVFLLVDIGKCPVNCINEFGQTPFMVACRSRNLEVVKWLASDKNGDSSRGDGGANVFIEDHEWTNALHAAAQGGDLEVVSYVASLGLSVTSKSKEGKTPVDLATDVKVIELLKKLEAEKWVKEQAENKLKVKTDSDGEVISSAVKAERKKVSSKSSAGLPSTSARVRSDKFGTPSGSQGSTDDQGKAMMHENPHVDNFFKACVRGDIDAVKWYLSQRHDIFVCNEKGSQALHFASSGYHLDVIQLLVEAGAELEVYNHMGVQPMSVACANLRPDDFSVVKWMASQGAEVFSAMEDVDITAHPMYHVACCSFDCPELIFFLYQSCPLLKYNVKVMNKSEVVEWSMLHCAALHGTLANVDAYFDIGMKIGPRLYDTGNTPLHCSVLRESPDVDIISLILKHCERDDIIATDLNGRTAIFLACLEGNLDAAMRIADAGFNSISIADANGNTCLHAACQSGNYPLVNWLKANHPEQNVKNDAGVLPEHHFQNSTGYSLNYDDPDLLKRAFASGNVELLNAANCVHDLAHEVVQIDTDTGCPHLHSMAGKGYIDAVAYLVEKGAPLDVLDDKGWSPLHYAVVNGHVKLMQYFVLQRGVNIFDTCGDDGSSCLHLAIRGYDPDSASDLLKRMNMATELLQLGLDVNGQDFDGNTPAHVAAVCTWLDMILLLQDNGADFFVKNGEMMSVLHELVNGAGDRAELGEVESIIDQLIGFGCDIDIRGINNLTPFHLACANGNVTLCNYLFESGSNIRLTGGKDGLTAVHIAAIKGKQPVLEWLISRGMRHDAINGDNKTPADIAYTAGLFDIYDWLVTVAPTIYMDRFSECLMSQLFWAIDLEYFALAGIILEEFLECAPRIDICTEEGSSLMHAAAVVGNTGCLQNLFARGLECDLTTSDGHTPLHMACLHERIGCVKLLLELGCDAKAKDNKGNSCLHMCVENDNVDIARLFCDVYENVDIENSNGWTPLHCCCCKGSSAEMLNLLLQQQVCVFQHSHDDETPLNLACKNGHSKFVHDLMVFIMTEQITVSDDVLDNAISSAHGNGHSCIAQWLENVYVENGMVQSPLPDATIFLIQLPPEMDGSDEVSGELMPSDMQSTHILSTTPDTNVEVFLEAVQGEDFPYVNALLKSGVDVNSYNLANKMTALHLACLTGNLLLVQVLVNKGADLNTQNVGGLTPLHISCDRQHEDIVLFLLEVGASLHKLCNNGNTVLHMMASRGLCNAIYQLKTFKKQSLCDVGARNGVGQNALHLAVVTGSMDTCEALIALGCPIDGTDFDGVTPLLLACSIDLNAIVTLLVSRGANVNHEDNGKRRPIHAACSTGNMLAAHTLIDAGATVSCVTDRGDTVLHICCRNGKLLLLKWLLKFGLDLQQRNLSNETPRDCAVANANDKIVAWIDTNLS